MWAMWALFSSLFVLPSQFQLIGEFVVPVAAVIYECRQIRFGVAAHSLFFFVFVLFLAAAPFSATWWWWWGVGGGSVQPNG